MGSLVDFEIIGIISSIERIAVTGTIRAYRRLERIHGRGRGRKLKGKATVRLADGRMVRTELHWYEAHGIGKKEIKIKRFLE